MDLQQLRADGMTIVQLAHNRASTTGDRDDALMAVTLESFMAGLLLALDEFHRAQPAGPA